MVSATYQQTNFLAGEWSPLYQGRADHPKYRSAMNLCLNGYPIEEGAWVRRSGFRFCAPSFKGQAAKLYPLFFTDTSPYDVEFTDGNIRFFNGPFPVITPDVISAANISTANPAVVKTTDPVAWATNDEIAFLFDPATSSGAGGLTLRQRTFLITMIAETYSTWSSAVSYNIGSLVVLSGVNYVSIAAANLNKTPASNPAWWTPLAAGASRTFSIRDAITGANIDGSTLNINTFLGVTIVRALRLATPYTLGTWANARIVQNQHVAVILNGLHIPQALQIIPNLGSNQAATASIKDMYFQDGPYLDDVQNSIATLSGLSGLVTCTVTFASYDATKTYDIGNYVTSGGSAYRSLVGGNINNTPGSSPTDWVAVDPGVAVTGPGFPNITGFQATDVGRLMRFYSQPSLYNLGGTYSAGNIVSYNNLVYQAIVNNASVVPDSDITIWKPLPTGALWTWGKITAVTNTSTVTVQILGDPLLYNLPITLWRLGVYSDTSGWPTCGLFNEGRLFLGGAIPNRWDTSMTFGVTQDGVANFAPTDKYGVVLDSSGISYTLEGKEQDPIYWFSPDQRGVLVGTKGGEWLIAPSTLGEAITPTNVKATPVTQYKAADIEPKRTGISLVFVQAFKRRVMEFLADVFTGRFVAPNLTETSKHLTQDGVVELGYQEELTPILWCRTAIGKLLGATYRRRSMMTSEAPEFIGWHQHQLGHQRVIESMAVGPNTDGTLDALALVTNDATLSTANQVRWIEQQTLMFDANDTLFDAWFLDGGAIPDSMYEDTVAGVLGQRLTGLWYLIGKTLTVFIAGLDVGDFTVDVNGTIFIPYGSGVVPAAFDFTAPATGAYLFTAAFVAYVKSLNLTLKNGGINTGGKTVTTTTTITTNPNNTSKIQDLQPAELFPRQDGMVIDWATGKLLVVQNGYVGPSVMNMVSGVEIIEKTIDTIMSESGDTMSTSFSGDVDSAGNAYLSVNSSTASTLEADTATLTQIAKGGGNGTTQFPTTSGLVVIKANSEYVVGVTNTASIAIAKAVDMSLLAGTTGGTDLGFWGFNQTEWVLESSGAGIAAGAPTRGNNVASAYIAQKGTAWPASFSYFFVGVADGVPTAAIDSPEASGKKGKGKAKKGAHPAAHIPSVATPQVYFAKIGTLAPTAIHPQWLNFGGSDGIVVDQSDNSVITTLRLLTSDFAAWSTSTVYNFDATTYSVWVAGNYVAGAFLRGTVLTNNTAVLYTANKATTVNPEAVGQVDWGVVPGVAFLAYDNAHAYVTGDYAINAGVLYNASQATTGNAPPNATYWTLPTTTVHGVATKGTRPDNQPNCWGTTIKNYISSVDPTVDTAGSNFPQTGTHWNQVPTDYIVAANMGGYSRTALSTGTSTPSGGNNVSLKWAAPITELPQTGPGMAQGNLNNGLFAYLSYKANTNGFVRVWLIDTVTGKYFVGQLPGISAVEGVEAWDSASQSFVGNMSYTSTVTGAPTALNSTATFANHWARLYIGNLTIDPTITSTTVIQPNGYTFIHVDTVGAEFPCVVGSTYTSQGQTLRAIAEQQSGARLGPALGKTRRSHKYAALLHNTMGLSVGTDFTTQGLLPALFKNNDTNALYDPQTMFSGIWKDALEGGYDFDSMLSWQISRPYPASVVSIGVFLKTQDE